MDGLSPEQGNPNPYASPLPFVEEKPATSAGAITPRTLELLNQTRPWVLLMGILGILGSILMFCGSGGIFIAGMAGAGRMELGAIAVVYVVMAVVYIIPAMMLIRYSKSISMLTSQPTQQNLESALEAQRNFWRFVGIVAAVVIALYFLFLIGAVMVGAFGARM